MDFFDDDEVRRIIARIQKKKPFKSPDKLNNKDHLLISIEGLLGIDYLSVFSNELGELSTLVCKKTKGIGCNRFMVKPMRKII